MNAPPVLPNPQQEKADREQLRVLAILHYIYGAMAIVGIGFLFLHHAILSNVFNNPEIWKDSKGGPPPQIMFEMIRPIYFVFGAYFLFGMMLNLLSAYFISCRQFRTFSLIVAGFNCLRLPFGTALGVFSFMVLTRESVQNIYAERAAPAHRL